MPKKLFCYYHSFIIVTRLRFVFHPVLILFLIRNKESFSLKISYLCMLLPVGALTCASECGFLLVACSHAFECVFLRTRGRSILFNKISKTSSQLQQTNLLQFSAKFPDGNLFPPSPYLTHSPT